MNYVLGDFLIRIKNAYMARKKNVLVPKTKTVKAVGDILKKEKYIKDIKEKEVEGRKMYEVTLGYQNRTPALMDVHIISKPSLRVYVGKDDIKTLLREMGTHILSTNDGMMSGRQAIKKGVGGEVICHVI